MFTSTASSNHSESAVKAGASLGLVTIAAILLFSPSDMLAAGQKPATPSVPVSSALGSDVVRMGEYNGNLYLFKPIPGTKGAGQIFKVASSDPNGAVSGIGAILNGQYMIPDPALKSDFFMAVDGKPASFFAGQSVSIQPSGPAQPVNGAPIGTAVVKDGMTEVTLAPSGDIVDFKTGGEILIRNAAGQTDARLTYNGTTGDQNAAQKAKRGLGVAGHLAILGISNNPNSAPLNPDNYTIEYDLARGRGGSANTELYNPRVRSEADPVVKAAARTLAAIEIVRKTKPDFSIPAENKLRQLVGSSAPSGEAK